MLKFFFSILISFFSLHSFAVMIPVSIKLASFNNGHFSISENHDLLDFSQDNNFKNTYKIPAGQRLMDVNIQGFIGRHVEWTLGDDSITFIFQYITPKYNPMDYFNMDLNYLRAIRENESAQIYSEILINIVHAERVDLLKELIADLKNGNSLPEQNILTAIIILKERFLYRQKDAKSLYSQLRPTIKNPQFVKLGDFWILENDISTEEKSIILQDQDILAYLQDLADMPDLSNSIFYKYLVSN